MTDNADRILEPTRLDRLITWTGVWSVTALATTLLITSAMLLLASLPGSEIAGNKPVQLLLGVLFIGAYIATVIPAGRILARGIDPRKKLLRAMPALASLAWVVLAFMPPLYLFAYSAGALPAAVILLLISTAGRIARRKATNQTPLLKDPSQAWTK